ncbi:MAG: AAA family ATPase [Solirubrobacteraceae bacterium]
MLVGRGAECARIAERLNAAHRRESGALLLLGAPGMGKSALLRFAREQAGGMTVLESAGVESEAELPYAGLSQLLAPVRDRQGTLIPRQREALTLALSGEGGAGVDRYAVYSATLALLAEVAEDAPVVGLVDDAHWLDRASAEAVNFVARRLHHEGVALIGAARRRQAPPLPAHDIEIVRLEPLDPAEAQRLLAQEAGVEVAAAVAEQLYRQTGGVPLALVELAGSLTPAQLANREPLPDPLPAGADIERAYGARIAALPDDAQRALLIAAANDGPDLQPVAGALASRGLALQDLLPAEKAGLIRIKPGRVEFVHPLLRAAAYGRRPPPERRDAPAALAGALQGSPVDRLRRTWHLAAAASAPDEQLARELEAVAGDAVRRAAPVAAGRGLEAAARVTPDAAQRARRLLAAARMQHVAGDEETAERLLDELAAADVEETLRADAEHLRAQVAALRTGPRNALTRLLDAAAAIEPVDPARAAAMYVDAALSNVMLGEPRASLAHAERAHELTGDRGPEGLLAALVLGLARILCGDAAQAGELIARAAPLARSSDPLLFGVGGGILLNAQMWTGQHAEARSSALEQVRRLRADGAIGGLPYGLTILAFTQFQCGEWRLAEATAGEALELGDTVGQPALASLAPVVLALVRGGRGELAEARAMLDGTLDVAERLGIGSTRTTSGWARGLLELGAGDYDEAIAVLEPTGRFSLGRGLAEPGIAAWAQDLAEAYIRRGQAEEAERTLAVLAGQAERTGRRLAHAAVARCRGLLDGDDLLDAHFAAALGWHEGVACPFERARTELCLGERLRRARRRMDAREPLQRALDAFEQIGAEVWAERARRELRATGERARRRVPEAADLLTPQELQVALQVAAGSSNREAAAALFVSPKTIESHLNSVYRKLGIRSRTELVRRLPDTSI